MKRLVVLVSLLAASMAGYAQGTVIGKWHGTERNFPTVDLAIGQDSGRAVFYLLKRDSDGSHERVDGQADCAMENLRYTPNGVSFDVRRKDGSTVAFHVVMDDGSHARLVREEDGATFPILRVEE
jgi:hypothetical protein